MLSLTGRWSLTQLRQWNFKPSARVTCFNVRKHEIDRQTSLGNSFPHATQCVAVNSYIVKVRVMVCHDKEVLVS